MNEDSDFLQSGCLYDLEQTDHTGLLERTVYPWEVLPIIGDYLAANLIPANHGTCNPGAVIEGPVFIGEGTVIEPGVLLRGPTIIGRHCRISHGACVRANAIIGDHCIVGHATEVKNSLLFNHCELSHFNYVGDSILGHRVHLGAGAKISNYRLIRGTVKVRTENEVIDTGLEKFGALIGDAAELGCNAVLQPGTILGKNCVVYPNVLLGGVHPANRIAKNRAQVEMMERTPKPKKA